MAGSDEQVGVVLQQGLGDPENLVRTLSPPENDFGKTVPETPVVVDLGKIQIFVRQVVEQPEQLPLGQTTLLEVAEGLLQRFRDHRRCRRRLPAIPLLLLEAADVPEAPDVLDAVAALDPPAGL